MRLNDEQQRKVEENIGLVGKVIKDRVHGSSYMGIYSYEDLFQIGCIGLCKAAVTDKGGCFSTYAYRLIWNDICSALVYASRRKTTEQATDSEILAIAADQDVAKFDQMEYGLVEILEKVQKNTTGILNKGIEALKLSAAGYSCREIGISMGANANNVTAWMSKARKYLKSQPELEMYSNAQR